MHQSSQGNAGDDPARRSATPPASTVSVQPSQRDGEGDTGGESGGGDAPLARAATLAAVLEEYLAAWRAGKPPSNEQLTAAHPDLASLLQGGLPGLKFIHAGEGAAPGRPPVVGDFRILSEIGRGGMGAVYQAEQMSLRRLVALKILSIGAVQDAEAIERFRREAETVAGLHHTNIVPIFAVGNEAGINYYAMQLIDGPSLAEVVAANPQGLSAEQVAQWGLQVADALAHAHQRGVIHRDIKPSNLLLGADNRVWLTDFGLARRSGDVTLSLTGALLGTPRYMSPEQASGCHEGIDQRSDLFSYGAMLYELLTGRAAFAGGTPHEVIEQILTAEPVPLRKLAPATPRDLETVVMKCLAKERAQRYADAQTLAEELRAVLQGRPIRARRAGPVALLGRWLRRREQTVRAAGVAAAVTAAVILLGIAGWTARNAWRQSQVRFDTPRAPLTAELLDSRGQLIRTDTVPMQAAAPVPAGEYQVRVSGGKALSQTYDVTLRRGEEATHSLQLDDQMLWPTKTIERGFAITDIGREQAIVHWTRDGMKLRRGQSPFDEWTLSLTGAESAAVRQLPGWRWAGDDSLPFVSQEVLPWTAPRTLDLDGDEVGDLLCAGRSQAWIMAVSGRTGAILWLAGRSDELRQPFGSARSGGGMEVRSGVVGDPVIGHDCDGDGVNDIVATLVDIQPDPADASAAPRVRRWVEALSGKTGEPVWTFELPPEWFDLPVGEEVPYRWQWFQSLSGSRTTEGSASAFLVQQQLSRDQPYVLRTDSHVYRPDAARLIQLSGRPQVVVVGGTHLIALDPANGKAAAGAVEIGHRPGQPPQWTDVDGDGSDDLVLIQEVVDPAQPQLRLVRLAVWSFAQQQTLWAVDLDAVWPHQPSWSLEAPRWPLVCDLNGDGRAEIAVPSGRSSSQVFGAPNRTPWGAVSVLAGDSGRQLWQRRIVTMDRQINHLLAGPDLDGDGWAEIFTASLAGAEFHIYCDALSGADGHSLWRSSRRLRNKFGNHTDFALAPLAWWRSGRDGWPQLLVHGSSQWGGTFEAQLQTFSAATGELGHVSDAAVLPQPVDCDHDGLDELLLYEPHDPESLGRGGRLHCVRGIAAEPWRRLGDVGTPVADLDGDAVSDLVRSDADGNLLATSGRQGRLLWQTRVASPGNSLGFRSAAPHPHDAGAVGGTASGDLDGDAVTDLLVWPAATFGETIRPLRAVSGRTGKLLWSVPEVTATMMSGVYAAQTRDLDGDAEPEVIWIAGVNHRYSQPIDPTVFDSQLWLFVCSGRSGKLKWEYPLSPAYGQAPGNTAPFHSFHEQLPVVTADLDGDGTQDVIVPAVTAAGSYQYLALSGTQGQVLWQRDRLDDQSSGLTLSNWIAPAAVDFEGDGSREVVVVEPAPTVAANQPRQARITALRGRDGQELWSHDSGNPYAPRRSITGNELEYLRPVSLRGANGQQRLAVYLPGPSEKVVVLGSEGVLAERRLLQEYARSAPWPCDAIGDGADELVFFDRSVLVVAAAENLDKVIWQHDFQMLNMQIIAVTPAQADMPPAILVTGYATDNGVRALDGRAGRMLWSCPGPVWQEADGGVYRAPATVAVLGGRAGESPHVLYAFDSLAICRQAVFARPAARATGEADETPSVPGGLAVTSFAARGVAVVPAVTAVTRPDERWLRDLPWRLRREVWGELTIQLLWILGFSLILWGLPAAWLTRVIRRRGYSLRTLLALPVVVGVCALAVTAELPSQPLESSAERILAGGMMVPVIIATLLLGRLVRQRRWRHVGMWFLVSIVVSAALAIGLYHAAAPPLVADEQYDWTGWPAIWLPGAYFTTWLATLVWGLGGLLRWLARRLKSIAPGRPTTRLGAAPG